MPSNFCCYVKVQKTSAFVVLIEINVCLYVKKEIWNAINFLKGISFYKAIRSLCQHGLDFVHYISIPYFEQDISNRIQNQDQYLKLLLFCCVFLFLFF